MLKNFLILLKYDKQALTPVYSGVKLMNRTSKILISLAVILSLLGTAIIATPLLSSTSMGFSQGTQGFSFSFDRVYWNGAEWSATSHGGSPYTGAPSSQKYGYTLSLDPDSANDGMPDLSVTQGRFIPDFTNSSGENQRYLWQIANGSTVINGQTVNRYEQFQMQLVRCEWSFNVYLTGTGSEAGFIENLLWAKAPNWAGARIGITLTPNSFAYFSGNPNHVYFAPAYIGLGSPEGKPGSEWTVASYGSVGDNWLPTQAENQTCTALQGVTPSNRGEAFGIYYDPYGANVPLNKDSGYIYQGQVLDSSIFRDKYYTELTLNNFYAMNQWGDLWMTHHWSYPSVKLNVLMYVWVVGEWETYFTPNQIPELQTHGFGSGTESFPEPTDPVIQFLITMVIVAIIAIVIIVIVKTWASMQKKGFDAATKIIPVMAKT